MALRHIFSYALPLRHINTETPTYPHIIPLLAISVNNCRKYFLLFYLITISIINIY